MIDRFPEPDVSRALVHIAFHFMERRLRFLRRVVENVAAYGFRKIDCVVDTNSDGAAEAIREALDGLSVEIRVHDRLDHPYLLTWTHRDRMARSIGEYEYFMYLEDDIVVPWESIHAWRDVALKLDACHLLPGFIRVESRGDGVLVSTDHQDRMPLERVWKMGDQSYLVPENPYQGFWIYSRAQMIQFVDSPAWIDGNQPRWGVRERAAAGMAWLTPHAHRVVIPIGPQLEIRADTFAYHIPNNYASDATSRHGKIPVFDLIDASATRGRPLGRSARFRALIRRTLRRAAAG